MSQIIVSGKRRRLGQEEPWGLRSVFTQKSQENLLATEKNNYQQLQQI